MAGRSRARACKNSGTWGATRSWKGCKGTRTRGQRQGAWLLVEGSCVTYGAHETGHAKALEACVAYKRFLRCQRRDDEGSHEARNFWARKCLRVCICISVCLLPSACAAVKVGHCTLRVWWSKHLAMRRQRIHRAASSRPSTTDSNCWHCCLTVDSCWCTTQKMRPSCTTRSECTIGHSPASRWRQWQNLRPARTHSSAPPERPGATSAHPPVSHLHNRYHQG